MSVPMISVIMPTYNSEKYVGEAVESILSQTYSDFEFLMINEYGSDDKTVQIVESYADPRIRVIQNTHRLGVAESLNEGIRQSRGKYIARMDSDDISLPERFERQVAFMEERQEISICGAWARMFGDYSGLMRYCTEPEQIKTCLLLNVEFAHPTVMFRANDIAEKKLWYSPRFFPEDFDLFSRAAGLVLMANIPEVLLEYRVYNNNTTKQNIDRVISDYRIIITRTLEKNLSMAPKREQTVFLCSLKSYLTKKGDIETARRLLNDIVTANDRQNFYNDDLLKNLLNKHYYSLFSPYVKADFPSEISDFITHEAYEMGKKTVLFGTGKVFEDISSYFIVKLGNNLSGVSDNDPQKWNKMFNGLKCIPPEQLPKDIGIIVLTAYSIMPEIIAGLKNRGFSNIKPFISPVFKMGVDG